MRTFAKTTDQGTAAAETGICFIHDSSDRRAGIERRADFDVTGPWVETTDNPEIACIVCGRSGLDNEIEEETDDPGTITDKRR